MTWRVTVIYLLVAGLMTAVAYAVVVIVSGSMTAHENFRVDRIDDTVHLAAVASPATRGALTAPASVASDSGVVAEMQLHQQEHQGAVVLLDARGHVVRSVPAGTPDLVSGWDTDVAAVLAGDRTDAGVGAGHGIDLGARPLVITEPVQSGTVIVGAVVTISPTTALRRDSLLRTVLLAGVVLVALTAIIVPGGLFARSLRRPFRQVDLAARAIAAGQLDTRAPLTAGSPELRRLAATINAMAERLKVLLCAQRHFVADASHQMRNPLTALRLRVENLEHFVSPDGQDELAKVVSETRRFAGLVNALLALARTEAREVASIRMDALAVAGEQVDMWHSTAMHLGVRLSLHGPSAPVSCAPDVLDQVLDVLLDNALHMAPIGSTVQVRTTVDHDRVTVRVTDQGRGMTADEKRRACERFWRADDQAGRAGSGLGLAIATVLLRSVGGSLVFDDVQPRGLEVVIELQSWPETTDAEIVRDSRGWGEVIRRQARHGSRHGASVATSTPNPPELSRHLRGAPCRTTPSE